MIVPHHYRITVDALDPTPGEEGLQSLSFFASTHTDIFAAVGALRDRLECTACHATRLAVGLSLLSEVVQQQHTLLTPLSEHVRELIAAMTDSPDVSRV
ncbi:MAG: hypothetical protein QOK38_3531 [Acidobacteriaceae bacterium]|nr:hypothetical protein [Acidobacteriaceae bacterium]